MPPPSPRDGASSSARPVTSVFPPTAPITSGPAERGPVELPESPRSVLTLPLTISTSRLSGHESQVLGNDMPAHHTCLGSERDPVKGADRLPCRDSRRAHQSVHKRGAGQHRYRIEA